MSHPAIRLQPFALTGAALSVAAGVTYVVFAAVFGLDAQRSRPGTREVHDRLRRQRHARRNPGRGDLDMS